MWPASTSDGPGTPSSVSHYHTTPLSSYLPSVPFFSTPPPAQGTLTDLPPVPSPRRVVSTGAIQSNDYEERVSSLDWRGFSTMTSATDRAAGGAGTWLDYLYRGGNAIEQQAPAEGADGLDFDAQVTNKSKRESMQYLLTKPPANTHSYSTTGNAFSFFSSPDIGSEKQGFESTMDRSNRPSKTSLPRRTLALLSGSLTTIVILYSAFLIFESVYALVNAGPQDDGIAVGLKVLRWSGVALGSLTVGVGMSLVGWLQLRHTTSLSIPLLILTTLVFILHLFSAIANFILVFIWYPTTLIARCGWGVDVAWILGDAGQICEAGAGASQAAWGTAAGVRAIVVIILGAALLISLRAFYRSLVPPLLQHEEQGSVHPDRLPPMPEHSEFYSLETSSSLSKTRSTSPVGWGSWIGGKVIEGLAWLIGIEGPNNNKEKESLRRRHQGEESGKEGFGTRLDRGAGATLEDIAHSQHYPDFQREPYMPHQPLPVLRQQPLDPDDPEMTPFFPSSSTQLVHPPSLQPHYSPTSTSYLQTPASLYRDSFRAPSPPPTMPETAGVSLSPPLDKESVSKQSRFPSGSSGSTGGAYVYVRMSDGRLVRKLSTIASESSVGGWAVSSEVAFGERRRVRERSTSEGSATSKGWRKKVPEY